MRKSEKMISNFYIVLDSASSSKNNDINDSPLFRIFVEIAFGSLSRSDKKISW